MGAPADFAVSATGDGEAFMRALFANEIHARMLYAGEDVAMGGLWAPAMVGANAVRRERCRVLPMPADPRAS